MSLVKTAVSWCAWWAGFFGLYLLLACKLGWDELVVGAAAAATLGATAATVVAQAGDLHYRPRPGWLRLVLRLPWQILRDCGVVALALWKRVTRQSVGGVFRTIPFDAGGDDSVSAARRALVTACVSIAPNTYVVGIDRQRGILLVHQMIRSSEPPGSGDREWPL